MQMQNQNTPLWNITTEISENKALLSSFVVNKHHFTAFSSTHLGLLPHLWLASVFIHFFMAARILFSLNMEDKTGTSVFMDTEKNYERHKPLPCLEYIFFE